jgi:PTH1 family peptidyl-tRNA hydrolase
MKLIVGLGNPGEKYRSTKHNVGFAVIERLSEKFNLPLRENLRFKANVCRGTVSILVQPLMFMNCSGIPVSKLASFFKIGSADIWVVHDDIDLPLGKIRIRKGGASGGHRGVESIMNELKTDQFVRFRLGVGRGKEDIKRSTDRNIHRRKIEKFVLEPFSEKEIGDSRKMIGRAVEAIEVALEKGLAVAMNRFN